MILGCRIEPELYIRVIDLNAQFTRVLSSNCRFHTAAFQGYENSVENPQPAFLERVAVQGIIPTRGVPCTELLETTALISIKELPDLAVCFDHVFRYSDPDDHGFCPILDIFNSVVEYRLLRD